MSNLEDLRHQGRHAHLFGTDYRWQHTDGRWTLRRETDDERDERLHQLFADPGWTAPTAGRDSDPSADRS